MWGNEQLENGWPRGSETEELRLVSVHQVCDEHRGWAAIQVVIDVQRSTASLFVKVMQAGSPASVFYTALHAYHLEISPPSS